MMSRPNLHIGCSSFNEKSWQRIFYPENLPRKDWFAYYCRFFDTYEINATFYKFPTDKSLKSWYDKAPEDFSFSVKMNKVVTHFKRFKDCRDEIDKFYALCSSQLKEKLDCILFQLPPSLAYSDENLELVLSSLDYDFNNVIEFRNKSWWRAEVIAAFRERNLTFCNVSYPGLPDEMVATSKIGYLRFHGVPKLFYSSYGAEDLSKWADEIRKQPWTLALIYFNNTASKAGIQDAISLKKMADN